jgi:hypothetical protein
MNEQSKSRTPSPNHSANCRRYPDCEAIALWLSGIVERDLLAAALRYRTTSEVAALALPYLLSR